MGSSKSNYRTFLGISTLVSTLEIRSGAFDSIKDCPEIYGKGCFELMLQIPQKRSE